RHRVPRVRRAVFLRRQLRRLGGQLLEPCRALRALLAVFVARLRALARLLEAGGELGVDVGVGILREPLPLGARDRETIERVLAGERFDALAELGLHAARCRQLGVTRLALGLLAATPLERRPRRFDRAGEPRPVRAGDVAGRAAFHLAPVGLDLIALIRGAERARVSPAWI